MKTGSLVEHEAGDLESLALHAIGSWRRGERRPKQARESARSTAARSLARSSKRVSSRRPASLTISLACRLTSSTGVRIRPSKVVLMKAPAPKDSRERGQQHEREEEEDELRPKACAEDAALPIDDQADEVPDEDAHERQSEHHDRERQQREDLRARRDPRARFRDADARAVEAPEPAQREDAQRAPLDRAPDPAQADPSRTPSRRQVPSVLGVRDRSSQSRVKVMPGAVGHDVAAERAVPGGRDRRSGRASCGERTRRQIGAAG